ncbi:hypothetical protein E4U02_14850 [Microbacterium paludicola]|uniref:Uncharacterized protein n=1 Tax=Microbacterium paludicola TaxID=300019 RepID=A0A4Y9FP14_9MICO|nr:hypothetical protein [Microbacterium paludicola]MBF0817683.1 hypothetical protein [Microbacterium paludicola]TFU30270.1 hypothetical protein E4U02_14850 [Microbacterium paludicola]
MIDLFRLRGPSRYTFESPGQPLPLVASAFDYYAGLKAAVDASSVEALIERTSTAVLQTT